jgi:hypothetical protein
MDSQDRVEDMAWAAGVEPFLKKLFKLELSKIMYGMFLKKPTHIRFSIKIFLKS